MSQYTEEGIVDIEQRTKDVGKILNDPTLFPVEFLSWIKRFIEQSGLTLPASTIFGGFDPGGGSVRNMAAGLFVMCGSGAPPSGSLACDGTVVSRTTYSLLYDRIGSQWGAVTATTFTLPDLRDRVIVGAGGYIGVGQTDGRGYGNRHGPVHSHSANNPPHSHAFGREVVVLTPGDVGYSILGNMGTKDVGTEPAGVAVTVGPGGTNVDAPTFAGVLMAITTGGQ